MHIKGLIDEDFVNYKVPSMFVITSQCDFKCDKECGKAVCQNLPLATYPVLDINTEVLVDRYIRNDISKAVVIGGLEPFDTADDLFDFICKFRKRCDDDIVIYTGYYEHEIQTMIDKLKAEQKNIVVKFGRFIPDKTKHYDSELGIYLASDNQIGVRIC